MEREVVRVVPLSRSTFERNQRWWALAVVMMAGFLVVVAASVANLAMPAIQATFHASFGEAELVVAGYALAYAGFLVTGGRLGDRVGRRTMVLAGLAVFTVGAAIAATAPTTLVLILARLVQGAGAALLYPQMLSIIQDTFSGDERAFALGLFGSAIGVGLVAGQLAGGALISLDLGGLTWRPAFLVLIPISAAALAGTALVLPDSRAGGEAGSASRRSPSLDYGGTGLLIASLVVLVLPLLVGADAGWPAWLLLPLVASPLAFVGLGCFEHRLGARGGTPLLHPVLFRQRSLTVGCLIGLVFFGTSAAFLVYTSLTLQIGLGFSALAAALTGLPLGIMFVLSSLAAPRLLPYLGRHVMTVGFLLLASGELLTLAVVHGAGSHVSGWSLAPGLVLMGIGQGLGMAPLVGTVLAGVSPQFAGAASGALSTAFQAGQALGVAAIGLVFSLAVALQPAGASAAGRYLAGYQASLPVMAVLATLAVALVFALPAGGQPNALLERMPGRLSGLVYSFFFLTGGRVTDRMLAETIGRPATRRAARMEEAPPALGDFMVHHFERSTDDLGWLQHLVEEAQAQGSTAPPHEQERHDFVQRQVDEIRRRQARGLVPHEYDPEALRLMVFALASYPRLLPQMVRMTTGHAPDTPEFRGVWGRFLRQLGGHLTTRPARPAPPAATDETATRR
jgi:MFS family permease